MKKIALVFAFSLYFHAILAQEKEGYWGLAVGLRSQTVQDQLITRSRYTGAPIYFMINHERQKTRKLSNFQFEGSVGPLKTREFELGKSLGRYKQPQITSYWNEISYSSLFLLRESDLGNWWLGPSLSNLIHVRFAPRWDNSSINYDFTGNLQAAFQHRRSFKFVGKNMIANIRMNLPLIGYITRPIYAGVPDFLDQERGFESQLFENTSISWLGNFPRIQFDNFVAFPIAGGNKIQLIYNWEYYSFQDPNPVQTASHTVGINFLMRTK
ncbi:hypothetical protein SAMN05192553_10224 [Cyclobacterium xiamenense]|uniref:Uncharacterized protein n=1 Tax=Cyclobacterium xiamenense TaxID=1297121 RepID=A0A1H6VSA6_9BACT|nr:hypothetical protein [Cyclobacterium xiamenense]SEJ02905.1 hypothetical protein SAMN05192553_10224 [Cyclobacterium xiamenense]